MYRGVAGQEKPDTNSMEARRTLSGAVLSAASILGLKQGEVAQILGLSAATVSRMASGAYLLDPERKEWQLAALLVRVYRSLDSITGGRDEVSRAWLNSGNAALGAKPVDLLRDVAGLVMVGQYLDASRAVV